MRARSRASLPHFRPRGSVRPRCQELEHAWLRNTQSRGSATSLHSLFTQKWSQPPALRSLDRAARPSCRSQHKAFHVFPLPSATTLHSCFFFQGESWMLAHEERRGKTIPQGSNEHKGCGQQLATEMIGCCYRNYTTNYAVDSIKTRFFPDIQAQEIN